MDAAGSQVVLDPEIISVFLLVLARMGGWAFITPLLGARGTAPTGRIALSIALAVVLTPTAMGNAIVPPSLGMFTQAVLVQFLYGAAFGFLTGLFFYVAGMAGSIIDLMSGLGYAAIVDPASGQNSATFSRFFSITFLALLFGSGAYLTVIYGLGQTIVAVPVGPSIPFDPGSALVTASAVTATVRAALLVAAPLMGILLLTEVALAIGARFFPQANVAFLGLGVKAFIALTMSAAVLVFLPLRIDSFIAGGADLAAEVLR